MRLTPGKFYKGRSQEKTRLQQLKVFLPRSPFVQAGSVLTFRATCSAPGHGLGVLVFSTSGVHRLFATKSVCSETSKQNGRVAKRFDEFVIAENRSAQVRKRSPTRSPTLEPTPQRAQMESFRSRREGQRPRQCEGQRRLCRNLDLLVPGQCASHQTSSSTHQCANPRSFSSTG